MVCKKCGNEIKEEWEYCPNCNKRLKKTRSMKAWQLILVGIVIYFGIALIFGCIFSTYVMSLVK